MKKKLLMLTPEIPRRFGTGGEVRTFHFYRTLTDKFQLTLVVLVEINDPRIVDNLSRTCQQLIFPKPIKKNNAHKASRFPNWDKTACALLWPPTRGWIDYWDQFSYHLENAETRDRKRGIFRDLYFLLLKIELYFLSKYSRMHPLKAHYLYKSFLQIKQNLEESCRREYFDVLWIEHTFAYPIAREISDLLIRPFTVCVAHNIESDLFKQYAKILKDRNRRFFFEQQINILRRLEKETFEECDMIFLCSEVDRLKAKSLAPKAEFAVAANGVDIESFMIESPKVSIAESPKILFTGGMNYPPNADAVRYFLKEIFSRILKEVPNCEFIIAGRHAKLTFEKDTLDRLPIRIVSDPKDMRPVFIEATVFVVPLRMGGGTRLKILEAMAMGCPVVSTKVGAEGVPYLDGEHLLLADKAEDFANQVVLILRNHELRSQLSRNAASWVRKHYSWKVICQRAVEHLMTRLNHHC